MKKIFISYSSSDRWVAKQLFQVLENEGHQPILDEKDIRSGDSITEWIRTGLGKCDDFLLLLSPTAIKSQWVLVELGGALALDKRVIPVLLSVAVNELPDPIANHLARDINDFDRYLQEIKPIRTALGLGQGPVFVGAGKAERNVEFAIGDRVQIEWVENLTNEEKEKPPRWVPEMDRFSGREAVVSECSAADGWLKLNVDGGAKWWLPRWLKRRP